METSKNSGILLCVRMPNGITSTLKCQHGDGNGQANEGRRLFSYHYEAKGKHAFHPIINFNPSTEDERRERNVNAQASTSSSSHHSARLVFYLFMDFHPIITWPLRTLVLLNVESIFVFAVQDNRSTSRRRHRNY